MARWAQAQPYATSAIPYIGENGNWWVNQEDTGVKAQGPQGERGARGEAGIGAPGPALQYEDITEEQKQELGTHYTADMQAIKDSTITEVEALKEATVQEAAAIATSVTTDIVSEAISEVQAQIDETVEHAESSLNDSVNIAEANINAAAANAEAAKVAAENAKNTATTAASACATHVSNAQSAAATASYNAGVTHDNVTASATNATYSAASATKAQSYAVGGTDTRDGENVDNAKYYCEQAKQISQSLGGMVPMGTVTFEELPTEEIVKNAMYNISNAFTSDARFVDGGGRLYGAGSNVYYTAQGLWDVLAANAVTGVKGAKQTSFQQGNVVISAEDLGLGNVNITIDAIKNTVGYVLGNSNLLPLPYAGGSGITTGDTIYSVDDTGVISITQPSGGTGQTVFNLATLTLAAGTYTVNRNTAVSAQQGLVRVVVYNAANGTILGMSSDKAATFTIDTDTNVFIQLSVTLQPALDNFKLQPWLAVGEVTSVVDTSRTVDARLTVVEQQLDGLSFVRITQAEYDALGEGRPSDTVYMIVG